MLILLVLLGCAEQNVDMVHRIDASTITVLQLSDRIQELVDTADVTGLTVTVFNGDTLAYRRAFGYANYEKDDSLRTDQVFYGASLSKAVFGFIVAKLVEEGKIDLDRPLQEYFPVPIPELPFEKEWRGFANLTDDPRYKDITARMCLSHTTGLPNWRWISRAGEFTPEGKIHFFFDPGSRYSYSGEGIKLLQHAVEEITGWGLEDLAREYVFDPLGMEQTSYVWQSRFEGNFVNGHDTQQKAFPKDREDEAGAAGSMETTPEDYALFLQHILKLCREESTVTDLMFSPNVRIRSKRQFGPSATTTTSDNDTIELAYGLGWGLLQTPYGRGVFKEGHGEGFQHYSILFPDQQSGVLLMSNSDNAESIFKELLELTIADTFTPWQWENYIPYDHSGPVSE